MKLKMFTVFDSKAEAYLPPFYMQSTGQALRSFEDTCNDETHAFHKHPADYTLFELGVWDDENCQFSLHDANVNLGNAIEHVAALNVEDTLKAVK